MITTLRRLMAACALGAATVLAPTTARAEITIVRIDIGLPNTAIFQITGEFDGNEILRFKSAIADVPPNIRIVAALNSPGGRLNQGMELGKFFYEAKIPTIVLNGHRCLSACTSAFFGGRDPQTGRSLRIMTQGARLGFHNFKTTLPDRPYTKKEVEDWSRDTQSYIFVTLAHLKAVGAPVRAIALSLGTPSEGMNYLSEADALSLGITVLNLETGRLVEPSNLASRTR